MTHYIDGKKVNALELLLAAAREDDRVKAALWECIERGDISRAMRTKKRDECLREAAEVLSADGCTKWQAAKRLAQAITNFSRDGGKLHRLRLGAVEQLSPVEQLLHIAFLAGGEVPGSPSYLHALL